MKDALDRVKHMENIVKSDDVLSCSRCHKNKGVLVDCENFTNLRKKVSYLKSSLERFFFMVKRNLTRFWINKK